MGNASSHSRSSSHHASSSSPSSSSQNNHSSVVSRTINKVRDRSTSSPPLTPQQILESENLIDGGHTVPMGLYQLAPQDFSQLVVKQLILDRKLAPFYSGLDDYEDEWELGDVLKAIREVRAAVETKRNQLKAGEDTPAVPEVEPKQGPPTDKEAKEAEWYNGASECPLCFLYYPSNINTSRCCDQPICTECFVQIKRAEATLTHLESEPACCPFCMEPNFGIVYNRPKPRVTLPHHQSSLSSISAFSTGGGDSAFSVDEEGFGKEPRSRRKSVNHTSLSVVTTDEIRPDWESKLEAVKAVAARRANRRIVMRQVGDRLIPVGITSSRTPIAPLQLGESESDPAGSGRRRGLRRSTGGEPTPLGPDIEEIMMMEAMRLSLLEHEQHQARQAAEETKKKANPSGSSTPTGASSSAPYTEPSSSSRASYGRADGLPSSGSRPASGFGGLPAPLIPTIGSQAQRDEEDGDFLL